MVRGVHEGDTMQDASLLWSVCLHRDRVFTSTAKIDTVVGRVSLLTNLLRAACTGSNSELASEAARMRCAHALARFRGLLHRGFKRDAVARPLGSHRESPTKTTPANRKPLLTSPSFRTARPLTMRPLIGRSRGPGRPEQRVFSRCCVKLRIPTSTHKKFQT